MTEVCEIRLWGTTIGALALRRGEDTASFEYDAGFLRSGIEVSPLAMPLSREIYRFPHLAWHTFSGLPGLVADSLPDKFGNALIDAWLAQQGRDPQSFSPLERLCYIGQRGMGALEYFPGKGPRNRKTQALDVEQLVRLASAILQRRESFSVSYDADESQAMKQILQIGTSAGGARAKAVICLNEKTREVRSGQVEAPAGFTHWLLKFDGVSNNRDKELADPQGFGLIEYAYYQMAQRAGIQMSPCQLLSENGRHHFMTRRFDRTADGDKVHMQTLGALAHYDFNLAGAYGYENIFAVMRKLELPLPDIEEMYRRMVFNILARNQDDHVKNTAFLMDRSGNWSLAPAYDLTFSFQPGGAWTHSHQMTVHGKRDHFKRVDLLEAAAAAGLQSRRALSVIKDTATAVQQWHSIARDCGISRERSTQIGELHRRDLF